MALPPRLAAEPQALMYEVSSGALRAAGQAFPLPSAAPDLPFHDPSSCNLGPNPSSPLTSPVTWATFLTPSLH